MDDSQIGDPQPIRASKVHSGIFLMTDLDHYIIYTVHFELSEICIFFTQICSDVRVCGDMKRSLAPK